MHHRLLTILPLFLVLHLSAQELYIPPGAEMTVQGAGTILTTSGQLINDGRLDLQTGTEFIGLGIISNPGVMFNSGTMYLYNDLTNLGTFNTSAGGLSFQGINDQTVTDGFLPVERVEVNKIGTVTFATDSTVITSLNNTGEALLTFTEGVLTTNGSPFVVARDASITPPNPGFNSYFQGTIISRGSGNRIFPVGDGGYYGTIELIDMRGGLATTELGVSLIHQNTPPPVPGPDLFGVSEENTWVVDALRSAPDSVQLQIDYIAEDLVNFTNRNEFKADLQSPVIAQSDSLPSGPFRSLGVESLFDTDADSTTMGILLAEKYASFDGELGPKYFAIAWAPLVDPEAPMFFPDAFSPADPNPINQTYKVFGQNVAREPFKIEIYNRFSILVYESDDFQEVNETGWDGTNLRGREEPTGTYYYYALYANKNDPDQNLIEKTGTILLLR